MSTNVLRSPFGEECCEHEKVLLQNDYKAYFFKEAPFNDDALQRDNYLIIGRRGTGKSSLAEYFKFQETLPNTRCIDVDEPEIYYKVLSKMSNSIGTSAELNNTRLVKIWEYLIWLLIFNELKDEDEAIKKASHFSSAQKPAGFIKSVLTGLINAFLRDDGELTDELDEHITSNVVGKAQQKAEELLTQNPIIIAIDTLERYDTSDTAMMQAVAALIQCSSNFNIQYAHKGIFIKTFIAAEIFPYISENEIANTTKFVRNPVYLIWRPKDLVKLISWRYYLYLKEHDLLDEASQQDINWEKFQDVYQKMWLPYYPKEIRNEYGANERVFPYILRHTQMRPRQLVIILNKIARLSEQVKFFPHFNAETIIMGMKDAEIELANEVINSYSKIYANLGRILDALRGFPAVFRGNLLDKYAPRTAAEWTSGTYSPYKFRQIIAEMGIVGRVRSQDTGRTNIIKADFEYALKDRLVINSQDRYVIHPMFYNKFNIINEHNVIVYPFPDHPDYAEDILQ